LDGCLNEIIYSSKFSEEIELFYISESENEIIVVVDDYLSYYKIDLEKILYQNSTSFKKHSFAITNFNPPYSLHDDELYFNYHNNISVQFRDMTENFNPIEFPLGSLMKSFDNHNYEPHLKIYKEYYFKKTEYFDNKYTTHGPINPYFFAIYHSEINLLEELLDRYKYPQSTGRYWSPLQYAFQQQNHSAIQLLCDKLFKRDYRVEFSELDFECLLNSRYSHCDRLLTKIFCEPKIKGFPKFMHMKKNISISLCSGIYKMLDELTKEQNTNNNKGEIINKIIRKITNKDQNINKEIEQNIRKTKNKDEEYDFYTNQEENNSKSNSKKEVVTYYVPFKYCYDFASIESITFLNAYTNSESEDFIVSEWSQLIKNKWNRQKVVNIIFAMIFWAFTITNTVSITFVPENMILKYVNLSFILFFVLFELIQLLAYLFYDAARYSNLTNQLLHRLLELC
jgi:hypothetical protein